MLLNSYFYTSELPVHKILRCFNSLWHCYDLAHINQPGPGDLELWPLNRFTEYPCDGLPSSQFFWLLKLCRGMPQTDGQTRDNRGQFIMPLPYGGIINITKMLEQHESPAAAVQSCYIYTYWSMELRLTISPPCVPESSRDNEVE